MILPTHDVHAKQIFRIDFTILNECNFCHFIAKYISIKKHFQAKSSRMWFKLNITIECFQYLNWSSSSPFKYWNVIGKVQHSLTRMVPLQVKTIKWNGFSCYPLPSIEFTLHVMYIFIIVSYETANKHISLN